MYQLHISMRNSLTSQELQERLSLDVLLGQCFTRALPEIPSKALDRSLLSRASKWGSKYPFKLQAKRFDNEKGDLS